MTIAPNVLHRLRRFISGSFGLTGRTGNPVERTETEAVDFTIRNVGYLIGMLGGDRAALRGRTFLEIGPGMDLGICLCVAGLGGSSIAVDRFLAEYVDELHRPIYERLIDAAHETWHDFDDEPIRDCLRYGAHEGDRLLGLAVGLEDADEIPDASVDIASSNATFEHLADVEASIRSLARITVPGGVGFHQTDFRDHRSMDRPLEFLTIEDAPFAQLLHSCEHSCGNRVRPHEFMELFRRHGFDAEFRPNMVADPEYLRDVRPRLTARYAALSDEQLRPISGRFHVRRR